LRPAGEHIVWLVAIARIMHGAPEEFSVT